MSYTPSDDNIDWSDLEAQMDTANVDDVVDVSKLGDVVLLNRYRELTTKLNERQETLWPRTEEGRELQSMRHACVVELKQRGLL